MLASFIQATEAGSKRVFRYFYAEPAFRSRCAQIGSRFQLWALPEVSGQARITIGDDVTISAHLGIYTSRILDHPTLVIGNRVVIGQVGHKVYFTVNRSIVLEDDVYIGPSVQIVDSDAHPRDPYLRAQKLPPHPDEIKATRICAGAVIGAAARIMKGVTVGEGAIVQPNSVVFSNVRAHTTVAGNPAKVVRRTKPEDGNEPERQRENDDSFHGGDGGTKGKIASV